MDYKNRYIITGGPGSGKSTLLQALKAEGYCGYNEISRTVIREQQAIGGDKVPWANLAGFATICNTKMKEILQNTSTNICFFDRGLPDIIAYLKRGELAIPNHFYEQCCNYNTTVFIAPPWRDIFINDAERPETFEHSEITYQYLKKTYTDLGFSLIELPKTDVKQRVAFVIDEVKNTYNTTNELTL